MNVRPITGILIAILLFWILFPAAVSAGPEQETEPVRTADGTSDPAVQAAAALLIDSERGQVLFGKSPNERLHIAALCKLVTTLIAVETGNLNAPVTISKDSVDEAQGSALSLEAGEKYSLEDLLAGIMLTSANDAANAVAEYVSKDVPSFVVKMNEMAAKLQMKDTHFTNPTGLYDEDQYTTAADISAFIKYACKNPVFNQIFGIQVKPWTYKDGKSKILTSQNKLFWSYSGIEGGKTGYNTKEQQSVITVASRDNMKLICVVLDSPEQSLFSDAQAMLDYGFQNFRRTRLIRKGEEIKTVNVDGTDIPLISGSEEYYVHPVGDSYIKDFSTSVDLKPPISTSKLSGNARYTLNDDTIIDIGLYPAIQPAPPADDFITAARKTLMQNRDILYLLVALIAVEAVLIVVNIFKFFIWIFKKLTRKRA